MTKRQTLPDDLNLTIAGLNQSPEMAFFAPEKVKTTPPPKKKSTPKATPSIEEAVQAVAKQRAKKEYIRGGYILDKDLYQKAKAYANKHGLSFNALVTTLLKLAVEKGEQ